VERKLGNFYFATLIVEPTENKWAARMQVSDRVLTALNVL
jgi:hypothetical protein